MRYVKAFGYFLWDFVVGDSPEIAVACLVLLIVSLTVGLPADSGVYLLPIGIGAVLAASAYVGKMQELKK